MARLVNNTDTKHPSQHPGNHSMGDRILLSLLQNNRRLNIPNIPHAAIDSLLQAGTACILAMCDLYACVSQAHSALSSVQQEAL